jgi:hypothetical protein
MLVLLGVLTISVITFLMFVLSLVAVISIILVPVCLFILLSISWCRIFEKAGQPWWKSLIPVYNCYVIWKMTNKPDVRLPVAGFAVSLILIIIFGLMAWLAPNPYDTKDYIQLLTFETAFSLIAALSFLGWEIEIFSELSRAFGKNSRFILGLLFLPFIFLPVLAFGSSRYNQEKK